MIIITDLYDVNANMTLEQTDKRFPQSMMEKVSVTVDYHAKLRRANRSFKEIITQKKSTLRFIWLNIGRLIFKVAVWKSIYFYKQGSIL